MTTHTEIERDIVYDKFFVIESWAYRGRTMTKKGVKTKALDALKRIHIEMKELDALLKFDFDGDL